MEKFYQAAFKIATFLAALTVIKGDVLGYIKP